MAQPVSLPGERDGLMIDVRRYWRLARIVGHIGYGLFLAVILLAFWRPHSLLVRTAAGRWQRRLLDILAVDVEVIGRVDDQARFLVSNHVSWLDIPLIGAQRDVYFLSKAEVRDWPLIGRLAVAAGTLFIRRGAGESRQKAKELAGHLEAGRTVLVFPEGTTSDGRQLKRFFAQLFAAPVLAGQRVQPVLVQYLDAGGSIDVEPAFIGDDEFTSHLWSLLRRDLIRARVIFLPALQVEEDAEHLCRQARETIERALLR